MENVLSINALSVVGQIVVPGKIYCWLSSPQYFFAKFQTKTCYCWFRWSHSDSYWWWYVAAWFWVYGGPHGVKGFPLHVWCEDKFVNIWERFGKVVEVSPVTKGFGFFWSW